MRLKTVLLITCTAVCLAGQGRAEITLPQFDQDRELPVHVTANLLQYNDRNDILTAKGNALITQGTRSLKADTINLNIVTKETEAQGNVLLAQDGDTIECESFTINLDTQVGVVRQAKIFIKNENLHIAGRDIKKTGPNTYEVRDGTITTCDAKNPPWRIDAAEIDVEIEGYAVARHPLLRIKSLPVLYLPVVVVPVKQKRQTGFLIPEVGYSSSSGAFMENSFFWAINDQSDATFWLDTATRQGIGTGLEYRIKLAEQTEAKLYGYFSHEQDSYQDDRYRNMRDRKNGRYYLNFEGQHYFDADTYIKADVSQVSDRQFYYDYKSEIKRSFGDSGRKDPQNYEKEISTVFLNKNWAASNLLVNMSWYRDLRSRPGKNLGDPDSNSGDDTTVQLLPTVQYSSMLQPVGTTPLFYRLEAGYDNFWREQKQQRGQRLTMYPQLSMPMLFGGWLRFTPTAGMRGVYFFDLNRSNGNERNGVFPTINVNLATSFVRVFDMNGSRLQKIRHIIEPGFEYEFVEQDDQTEFPYFDAPEDYYRRHWAGYYLKNRFTALELDETGELSEYEIGYFKVGQLFNIADPLQGLYYEGDRKRTASDIFTEMRIDMNRRFYIKTKTYYDTYGNSLHRYSILGRLSFPLNNHLSVEYRYWRHLYEMLELDAYLRVTSWLALFARTRYDYLYNDDYDADLGIEYHSQCWGLRLWFESESGTQDTRSDEAIKAMFFVKGFGDPSVF